MMHSVVVPLREPSSVLRTTDRSQLWHQINSRDLDSAAAEHRGMATLCHVTSRAYQIDAKHLERLGVVRMRDISILSWAACQRDTGSNWSMRSSSTPSGQVSTSHPICHSLELGKPVRWMPFVVCAVLTIPLLIFYNRGRSSPPGAVQSHQASLKRSSHVMAGPADSPLPPLLQRPRILLFGDSLTERSFDPEGGWGATLAHHYARKVDVVNRGFGGYNSRQGRLIFKQVLAGLGTTPPLAMTLWFGANDAALPDRSSQRQHVPIEEYASNLKAILQEAQAAGIAHLLLITPPPVHEPGRVAHQQLRMGTSDVVPPDRTLSASGTYAAAAQSVGAAAGVPVLDMWTVMQQQPGWREVLLLPDGLHFSGAGQALVGRLVQQALATGHTSIRVEALANQLPWWDKWDSAAPASTWAAFLEQAGANTTIATSPTSSKGATDHKQQGNKHHGRNKEG